MDCPPTPPQLPRDPTPPPKDEEGLRSDLQTPAKSEVERPSPSGSPEPHCAICLGQFENISKTDTCFHRFCFTCLKEWSKVRPQCPLCKSQFSSIIHNIRADDNYESYPVPPPPPPPPEVSIMEGGGVAAVVQRLRNHFGAGPDGGISAEFVIPSAPREDWRPRTDGRLTAATAAPHFRTRRGLGTAEFRRHIYDADLWVDPESVVDLTGRVRETSPDWFRNNPATTHRLVPWLNREINALLEIGSRHGPQHSSYLLQNILNIIQHTEIRSQQFYDQLLPYTGNHTAHFQHEFYHFARNLNDMMGFDRAGTYNERRPGDIYGGSGRRRRNRRSREDEGPERSQPEASGSRDHSAPSSSNDTSANAAQTTVVISSASDSSTSSASDIEVLNVIENQREAPSTSNERRRAGESLTDRISRRLARHNLNAVDGSERTNSDNAPLDLSRTSAASPNTLDVSAINLEPDVAIDVDEEMTVEVVHMDDNNDDVEIIGSLPPRHLRTPEIINLSEAENNAAGLTPKVEGNISEIKVEREEVVVSTSINSSSNSNSNGKWKKDRRKRFEEERNKKFRYTSSEDESDSGAKAGPPASTSRRKRISKEAAPSSDFSLSTSSSSSSEEDSEAEKYNKSKGKASKKQRPKSSVKRTNNEESSAATAKRDPSKKIKKGKKTKKTEKKYESSSSAFEDGRHNIKAKVSKYLRPAESSISEEEEETMQQERTRNQSENEEEDRKIKKRKAKFDDSDKDSDRISTSEKPRAKATKLCDNSLNDDLRRVIDQLRSSKKQQEKESNQQKRKVFFISKRNDGNSSTSSDSSSDIDTRPKLKGCRNKKNRRQF